MIEDRVHQEKLVEKPAREAQNQGRERQKISI